MVKIFFELDSFYTAADLIAKLSEGDGAGSGFDADLLDGQHASYFLPAGTYTAADVLAKLLTVDGPGSGLDADKLDGTELAKILALGTTIPGSANLNSYTATGLYHQPNTANAASGTNYPVALAGMLEVIGDSSIVYQKYTAYDSAHSVYVRTCYNSTWYSWTRILDTADLTTINNNLALKLNASVYTAADILSKLLTVDGPGSGLDADTLDGTHLATLNSAINAKLNANIYTAEDILTKLKTVDGSTTGLDADLLDGQHASYFLPAENYTAADILTKLKTVGGPGSGLDADTVDGANPSATGTANALVKSRAGGTIAPNYLPFSDKSGTFRLPKLIEDRVITSGNAAQTQTFTGLDGNVDKEYFIKYRILSPSSGYNRYLSIFPNNDTTQTNYVFKKTEVDEAGAATSVATNQSNIGNFNGNLAGDISGTIELIAAVENGQHRIMFCKRDENRSNHHYYVDQTLRWTNTSSNINSLVFYLSSGTYYGNIKLYKMVDLVIS